MEIIDSIRWVVSQHFPGVSIQTIVDKGVWIKHIFEVTLDNGRIVYVKLNVHPEWGELIHDIAVEQIFREHEIPAPLTLASDMTCGILPYPFVIQERIGGIRLSQVIDHGSTEDNKEVYRAIGRIYRKMHSIHNERSGLWNDNLKQILYEISPNDYMYRAEMINGSGKAALESGKIAPKTYERALDLWSKNMEYLKNHQPSLIHGSPFVWTIYLDRVDGNWIVTKLMSLGDVLWWDAAYDVAFLLYPPFGTIGHEEREAFQEGYGELPESKRILLYALMQRFCAAMGVYMEPGSPENLKWREECLKDVDRFIGEIEILG